jgi:hypothetical protein
MHVLEPITDRQLVAIKRVTAAVWILRPAATLEGDTVSALVAAFSEALDRGARDVAIDLSSTTAIDADGAATICNLAEAMLERDSVLWLADSWPGGDGHTLKPIREAGSDALRGVSDKLDNALEVVRDHEPRNPIT